MALSGDNAFLKPTDPTVISRLTVPVIISGLGVSVYDLWRDWHHHRLDWVHIAGLLVTLYLTALICRTIGRVRQLMRRQNGASGKAA